LQCFGISRPRTALALAVALAIVPAIRKMEPKSEIESGRDGLDCKERAEQPVPQGGIW